MAHRQPLADIQSAKDQGASASPTGPAPSGLSPASGSQAEPLVPSADEHQRFTVSTTAYLRTIDRDAVGLAIHYQNLPRKTEKGVSFGLRFPFLIIADYVNDKQAMAEKVARILEQHWGDE